MMKIKKICYFLVCYLVVGQSLAYDKQASPQFMKDAKGRSLILHGVNISESAKHAPGRMPWHQETDIERLSKDWGFNTVRFTIFWDELMPQKGIINHVYIDNILERMDWFKRHNIYAVVDMHQNLYGKSVSLQCGDFFSGAPEWATYTDDQQDTTCDGGLNIVNSPATVAAYDNFWDYASHPELQDNFIAVWEAVANRLKNHGALLAYNAFNEPRPGDITESSFGDFNTQVLAPFYRRWIQSIRAIDNDVYLQLEPASIPANFGISATLPVISDPRKGERRIVYSPHVYPLFSTEDLIDNITLDSAFITLWNDARVAELNVDPRPLYVGEFGVRYLGTSVSSKDLALIQMDLFDSMLSSWAIWVYDKDGSKDGDIDPIIAKRAWAFIEKDGAETPLMNYIVRPYAQATAGTPLDMEFALGNKIFKYEYLHDPRIDSYTEIYVPFQRIYDNSWKIQITAEKSADYVYQVDEAKDKLYVKVKSSTAEKITIRIEDVETDFRNYRTFRNHSNSECLAIEWESEGEVSEKAKLVTKLCDSDRASQKWFYEHATGLLYNALGLCLTAFEQDLQVSACEEGHSNQVFTYLDGNIYLRNNSNLVVSLEPSENNNLLKLQNKQNNHTTQAWSASLVTINTEDWVNMRSESNGKCLDVENGSPLDFTRLQIATCNSAKNGQMFYHDVVTGIIQSKIGTCIDTSKNGSNNGSDILMKACDFSSAQAFDKDSSTHYSLRGRPSKRIHSPRGDEGYRIITYSHSSSGRDNFLRRMHNYEKLVKQSSLFYQLRSGKNGKCLAVTGDAHTIPTPGTRLQVQDCWFVNQNKNQLFYFSPVTKHLVTANGLCVDWGGTSVNGADVKVQECRTTRNQRFYFNDLYGTLQHTSAIAFVEFAIDGTSVQDGANVVLWMADGQSNQRWYKRTPAFHKEYDYPGAN
ncbi:MAG: ricin-type beta-trefoil lectin domain protein [Pseudomonadota bacterium]